MGSAQITRLIPPTSTAVRTFTVREGQGRRIVDACDEFPYRALVLVLSPAFGPSTGFLYGPDMVATAGHCVNTGEGVWIPIDGKYPLRVGFRTRIDEPYRWCNPTRLYAAHEWAHGGDERFDYGAIRLDREIGRELGWFDLAPGERERIGRDACVIGYGMRPWQEIQSRLDFDVVPYIGNGSMRDELDGQLFYDARTDKGMSGGPVCVRQEDGWRVAAIHAMAAHPDEALPEPHRLYSHGTTISREVFENLMLWREEKRADREGPP